MGKTCYSSQQQNEKEYQSLSVIRQGKPQHRIADKQIYIYIYSAETALCSGSGVGVWMGRLREEGGSIYIYVSLRNRVLAQLKEKRF